MSQPYFDIFEILDEFIFIICREINSIYSLELGGTHVVSISAINNKNDTFKVKLSKQDEKYAYKVECVCGYLNQNGIVKKTAVIVDYRKIPLLPR